MGHLNIRLPVGESSKFMVAIMDLLHCSPGRRSPPRVKVERYRLQVEPETMARTLRLEAPKLLHPGIRVPGGGSSKFTQNGNAHVTPVQTWQGNRLRQDGAS